MTQPYTYPTNAMMAAQVSGAKTLRGVAAAIDTSSLGAPTVVGGLRGLRQWLAITIAGADAGSVLFPPQQPLQPIAQPLDYGVIGRQWDYPVGWNTRVTPRTGAKISFPMLNNLAQYDVLRLIIERVKEEVVQQNWTVGPVDNKSKPDKRSDEVKAFLQMPDKRHTWDDWLKMLLDQMLVYDAPAIWLQPTRGGDLYGLRILDGSMMQPKIMADGTQPPPEIGPAYQQVVHGLPAVDYIMPVTRGQMVPRDPSGQPFPELLYKPRNPRVDSPYGFGPVEQMIVTINIALRREEYLQQYYTSGSMPDLIFSVPTTWNPNQIAQFQTAFNSILAGNLQNRREAQFVPDGVKPIDVKEKALTDQTDEYLVRILCFCLGISPMPFVKMLNRSSGEQHADQQKTEGIAPYSKWVRNLINFVIAIKFGYPDIAFRWEEEDASDPLEQAQRYDLYLKDKVYHPDEVRQKLGEDPMAAPLRAQLDEPTFSSSLNASFTPPDQQQQSGDSQLFGGTVGKYSEDQLRDPHGEFADEGAKGKGTNAKVTNALQTYKPSTKAKQDIATAAEKAVASALGGNPTPDNLPVDIVIKNNAGKVFGIEVKSISDNKNNKITMHPESLQRKLDWAKSNHASLHTVIVDTRSNTIYYRHGVGSFRLSSSALTKVTDGAHLRSLVGI